MIPSYMQVYIGCVAETGESRLLSFIVEVRARLRPKKEIIMMDVPQHWKTFSQHTQSYRFKLCVFVLDGGRGYCRGR